MNLNDQMLPWPVWLSWLEPCPVNQRVVGWIHGQGKRLGCEFDPQLGRVQDAVDRCF